MSHSLSFVSHPFATGSFLVNPIDLGFIPRDAWQIQPIPFAGIIPSFFQRRNKIPFTFPCKLVTALLITEHIPQSFAVVGVRWLGCDVIMVDGPVFARLLNVKAVEAGLFHQQGNFPSHGFVELPFEDCQGMANDAGFRQFDKSKIRFFRHSSGEFRRGLEHFDLEKLKWR
jgi:hypothetical protein